jgi:hypothetical protein
VIKKQNKMLKFLLISILCFYVFYKVSGYFFRFLFYVLGNRAQHNINKTFEQQQRASKKAKPADGNVEIDYVPNSGKGNKNDFKGGEYVDYEEVK